MTVIRIIGLPDGFPTPFDGEYLAEYDPSRTGVDPVGVPMVAHIVTTPDISKAMRFEDEEQATNVWRRSYGCREDGSPRMPLSSFEVEIEVLEVPA
jgi:hypothetical protein